MEPIPGLGGLLSGVERKEREEAKATAAKLLKMQQPLEDALRSLAAGGREDLLTAEQFGKRVGMHAKTVYKMAREGRLPSQRCGPKGRGVRFLASDVRAW